MLMLGTVLAVSSVRGAVGDADAGLSEFFRNYLEASGRLSPLRATGLGDHRFDQLLDDGSEPPRQRRTELTRGTLEQLPRRVAYAQLPRAGQVDYEILRDKLKWTGSQR